VLDLAASDPIHWESAASIAGLLFDWLIDEQPRAVLNCNVPDRPLEEILGLRVGGLAHIGAAQTSVTEEKGTPVRVTLGGEDESAEVESDAALLQRGFASVTALRPIVEDSTIDLNGVLGSADFRSALAQR
jgi:5'-nucleotidase